MGCGRAASTATRTSSARTISLGGDPYVVIGDGRRRVSRSSELGPEPALWIPFQLDPDSSDQSDFFQVAARLKPGVTLDQAQSAAASSRRTSSGRNFPTALDPRVSFSVTPFREAFVKDVRASAPGPGRRGQLRAAHRVRERGEPAAGARDDPASAEIAIRSAIGAGRGRISETTADRKRGAVARRRRVWAARSASSAVRALLAVNTADLPRLGDERIGGRTGLARAQLSRCSSRSAQASSSACCRHCKGSRADLNATLKESGRTGWARRSRHNRRRGRCSSWPRSRWR